MTERRMKRTRHRQTIEQNVYDAAIERTHHIFDNHDTVAVAFSGGKDSTATLNVVLEVANQRGHDKPIRVIFYDEEAIPFETEQYVRRVGQRDDVQLEWYCIPFIGNNHCSRSAPLWYPWAEEDEDKWVRPLPPEAIRWWDIPGFSRTLHTYEVNGLLFDPKVDGMTALCLGIRAQESMTRLRAVTRKVTDNYIIEYNEITSKGNLFKAYPIYDWVTEDVWTAPQKFGWDYNRAYDAMELAGLSITHQRCSPPYANEPLQKLWTYKVCFPDVWDKMCARVPGAATAARYAKTELYGFSKRPKKPDGVPWETWIVELINQWPPEERPVVAQRVKNEFGKHFGKTSDPIAATAPHPISGITWDFVVMLAMRGDKLNRKTPTVKVGGLSPEQLEALRVKYDAQIADMKERGEL